MDPPTEDELRAESRKPDPQDAKAVMPDMPPPPPPVSTDDTDDADADADDTDDATYADAVVSQSPVASNDQKESQGEDEDEAASEEEVKEPVTTTTTTTTTATSSNNTKPTPTPTMPGGLKEIKDPQPLKERRIQFLELRSYEAKRRTIYTSKMKSTNLYWRAFRNMLAQAYEETDRAENLVRGTLAANESYAHFLRAAAEDRLDYNGKPVDKKRGEKIKIERGYKYSSLGGGGLLNAVAAEQDRVKLAADEHDNDAGKISGLGLGYSNANANANINHNVSFDGLPEHSMLHSLIHSQIEMADVMTENINFVKDISLEKMHSLRKELEAEVSVMGALGDATMFELRKAEDDVQKSWGEFTII